MARQSNGRPFTAAHRTTREFVEQLTAWGFAQRKMDGVHLVFRGPHGGTLRVVRSLGRADPDCVDRAAALVGVTADRFWAAGEDAMPEPRRVASAPTNSSRPRRSADRDRVTSLVLGAHATADRPLGFDQVVELAGARVTRDQVRTASAQLCREGDLDRIRSGVYQWSGGVRSRSSQSVRSSTSAAVPVQQALPIPAQATHTSAHTSAMELFDQLFPCGVRMTADLLADFERWAELTEKLAQHAQAS